MVKIVVVSDDGKVLGESKLLERKSLFDSARAMSEGERQMGVPYSDGAREIFDLFKVVNNSLAEKETSHKEIKS